MRRGGAAAATRLFRGDDAAAATRKSPGDESRRGRQRGSSAETTTPRPRRGYSVARRRYLDALVVLGRLDDLVAVVDAATAHPTENDDVAALAARRCVVLAQVGRAAEGVAGLVDEAALDIGNQNAEGPAALPTALCRGAAAQVAGDDAAAAEYFGRAAASAAGDAAHEALSIGASAPYAALASRARAGVEAAEAAIDDARSFVPSTTSGWRAFDVAVESTVDRRAGLRPRDFLEDYASRGKPVVLTGLLEGWPATERWARDAFLRDHGDARCGAHGSSTDAQRRAYSAEGWSDRRDDLTTVGDFVRDHMGKRAPDADDADDDDYGDAGDAPYVYDRAVPEPGRGDDAAVWRRRLRSRSRAPRGRSTSQSSRPACGLGWVPRRSTSAARASRGGCSATSASAGRWPRSSRRTDAGR